jgi:DNA modification methylase
VQSRRKPDRERKRDGVYRAPAIANPGNVIRCHGGGGHLGSKLAHESEAPFSEKLVDAVVRSFCPPGGTVLDGFSGSGTTAAVCVATGRRFIGHEIRASQILLTRQRIAEAIDKRDRQPLQAGQQGKKRAKCKAPAAIEAVTDGPPA